MSRRGRYGRAFTLIELLAVVGVLFLLLSLLVPTLRSARKRAELVPCMNNLRQLYSLCIGYAGENSGVLPRGLSENPAQMSTRYAEFSILSKYMTTYGYTPRVWYCPSLTRLADLHVEERGGAWANSSWNGSTNWMATGTAGEFPLGYFYTGNLSTGSIWKFKVTPPLNLNDLAKTNGPFIWDYCLAPRPSPIAADAVPLWRIFSHYEVAEPGVCQLLFGNGSVIRRRLEDMQQRYNYIGAAEVYW